MTLPLTRPATPDGLFVWVLHRFAEVFEEHAVLKGGIGLRLLDCPRMTTDIDYVFVPFGSKLDIAPRFVQILREIEGADVTVEKHSKMLRARLRVDGVAIQIEATVAREHPSRPLPTGSFARAHGQPSRLVRVETPERALANKLAAWNERRLLRDLYDVYYLAVRLGATPDIDVLRRRLAHVDSKLPRLRKRRSMTLAEFLVTLRAEIDAVDDDRLRDELAPILPADELEGLVARLRAGVVKVSDWLDPADECSEDL
jgi:hypothetical protein